MKKLLALLLALALSLSMMACGAKEEAVTETAAPAVTEATEATVATEPAATEPATTEPATEEVTTKAPETTAPVEEKKGCGSSVTVAGLALVAALGTCTVFVAKKKED